MKSFDSSIFLVSLNVSNLIMSSNGLLGFYTNVDSSDDTILYFENCHFYNNTQNMSLLTFYFIDIIDINVDFKMINSSFLSNLIGNLLSFFLINYF